MNKIVKIDFIFQLMKSNASVANVNRLPFGRLMMQDSLVTMLVVLVMTLTFLCIVALVLTSAVKRLRSLKA